MKDNHAVHFYRAMPDPNFRIDIIEKDINNPENPSGLHWHEHFQFYYLEEGMASLVCGHKHISAGPGSLICINSCEIHSALICSSNKFRYYIFRIDPSFLIGDQAEICRSKYILPLSQNLICFKNFIENDTHVTSCVKKIINEYYTKAMGYELETKALVYHLLVLLLRNYVDKILTHKEFSIRAGMMKNLSPVFNFIENNYSGKITIHSLAAQANISLSHFCRIFKQATGKTAADYINGIRLSKAAELLGENEKNITEIAFGCGFCDANYFSRLFKKQFGVSPTGFRNSLLRKQPYKTKK